MLDGLLIGPCGAPVNVEEAPGGVKRDPDAPLYGEEADVRPKRARKPKAGDLDGESLWLGWAVGWLVGWFGG